MNGGYNSNADSRMLAFLCGALVGASAALLLAPMRGSEIRASLGDAARQSRDRVRRYQETGGEWAQERLSRASEAGRTALHRATDAVETAVDRAQSAVNQGASKAHEAAEKARTVLNRAADSARTAARDAEQAAADVANKPVAPREQWS